MADGDFKIKYGVLKKYYDYSILCRDDSLFLKKIIIPNGVTKIGDNAFENCKSLKEIIMPDGVTEIGGCAFKGCSSLKKIYIPYSVTKIGEHAFYGCSSLKEINVSPDNKYYSSENGILFSKNKAKFIQYPEGIYKKLYFVPNSVTEIGELAFEYCKSLKEIIIPDGVTEIGDRAFADCKFLEEINIPNSVKKIGNGVFIGCLSLKEIKVSPNNKYYFSENGELFCNGETLFASISGNNDCDIEKYDSYEDYNLSLIPEDNWNESDAYIVNGILIGYDGSVKESKDGGLCGCWIGDDGEVHWANGCREYIHKVYTEYIYVPDNIIGIAENAFCKCESLREIKLSKSIKEISKNAFNCKRLEKLIVPYGLDISFSGYPEGCDIIRY